ncbi:MAG TPA: sigma-70 family RNA polymerase sigma factor [Jatrophihabitans sp.]|nr:sigma-70 family RNA polymerase sigma factor [Jatrophihabitans sp.]
MSAGARARQDCRGFDSPAAGLRALVDLVNDALAAMGTGGLRLAPAGANGAVGPAGPLVANSALETPPSPRAAGRGRASRNLATAGSRPSPAPKAPEPADPPEIDETHVETWRLVARAQEGDGEAFGQLYDRYADTVYRFIYFRVNDRGLAEDFTSETFLRALRRIGSISYQGRDIGAWFVTIARNIVLDHLKSARHRLETTTADTIEGREHAQSTEAAVLDTLQSERLMQAVSQLGDEQRECVMLRFVHGMSVSETAQIMGKNDGAIKALQHRAVRKLADLVGSELR